MIKVVDMHCDTIAALYQKHTEGKEASILENSLSVSLEKMEKGGYGLQNFAMFINLQKTPDYPFIECMQLADTFFRQLKAFPEKIAIVKNWKEIEENWNNEKMSALLTVEEGGVCQGKLSLLRILYELGVRMMTLTWNHPNELGWPCKINGLTDRTYGLTEKGIAFIEEMERLGIIVDISHLSDEGIWDVFRYTKKPFVASHSNSRAVTPHPRNLTDEMIKALAQRGGVAGLNFYAPFLTKKENKQANPSMMQENSTMMQENLSMMQKNQNHTMMQKNQNHTMMQENPSRIQDMLRHLHHMKQVGGIEVIGLGTDFDGFDPPGEIRDASCMQQLAQAMEKDGFTTGEIEKVFYGNVLRVYREILS